MENTSHGSVTLEVIFLSDYQIFKKKSHLGSCNPNNSDEDMVGDSQNTGLNPGTPHQLVKLRKHLHLRGLQKPINKTQMPSTQALNIIKYTKKKHLKELPAF